MREIKFRGKEINNGEWVYGDLILGDCLPKRAWISSIHDRERLRSIDSGTKKAIFRAYEVDPETVGQYTGLKDKNGKEIYEGDIVKWWGYEVQLGRQIRPERIIKINNYIKDAYKILCITEDTGQIVEVIGNIFEDGDLIANR